MKFSVELDPFDIPFKLNHTRMESIDEKSILNGSLIELFVLDDSHIDSIWLHSNDLLKDYFHFSDVIWKKFNLIHIYNDDPISALITRSLKSILCCFETNDDLFTLFSYLQHYYNSVIGNSQHSLSYRKQNSSPIIKKSSIDIIYDLQLKLFTIPHSILKTLESLGYYCVNDFICLSELDILEKYGLCKKSMILIEVVWEISYYIKSIEESLTVIQNYPLPSKSPSLYSYILDVINCNNKRIIPLRNLEISLSYLLSIDIKKSQGGNLVYKKTVLKDLAKSYRMTRERIRQIIKCVLERLLSEQRRNYLFGIWLEIYNVLLRRKGISSLIAISEETQRKFGWQDIMCLSFWEKLIRSNPCLDYDAESDCVYIRNWECITCQKIRMKLREIIDKKNNMGSIKPINAELEVFCQHNCISKSSFASPNYKMLCRYYRYDIDEKVVFNKDDIYRYSDWKLRDRNEFSTVIDLIELL